MRPANLLEYIQNLALSFYHSIRKLIINAHQVIAHWRIRLRNAVRTSPSTTTSVELTNQIRVTESQQQEESVQSEKSSQQTSFSITTPNSRRLKLFSLLHRLSLRNFMEYCVIALNEASSSSCSNKFDLSSYIGLVWLLGQQYELPQDADKLVDDIRSKLWITYRRNFPPIDENTRYTSDRGFGCMIRCGQMVLANALLHKNLGRDWRWSQNGLDANPDVYTRILKLFQDKEDCPYSIHNIIRTGQQEGKIIGEWFGPNTIAQALKRMAMALSITEPTSDEVLISIDAALDNVVVTDEIKFRFKHKMVCNLAAANNGREKLCSQEGDNNSTKDHSNSDQWVPGILFIQLRLGLSKINPLYFDALRKTFQFKNSLGIIGGRPNHALYLIGHTDDDIIYLDPHSTQQYIDLDTGEIEERLSEDLRSSPLDSTYHCACPEKMPIDRLDPSLALCFYFHTEHDFDEWCSLSDDLLIKPEHTPMFEITKSRPTDWNITLTSTTVRSTYKSHSTKSKLSDAENNLNSNYDREQFTVLREFEGDGIEDLDLKIVDKSNASDNSQTNDDEEFEMLG